MMTMTVRPASRDDLDRLAEIWHEGWHDGHAHVVPAALTRVRTLEGFRQRLEAAFADIRVAGPPGAPVGFSVVKDDELYQLYVAAPARGSGIAALLIEDAEARLAAAGVGTAWLACAIGNDRAARFYRKRGWRLVGTTDYEAETETGPFALRVWRFEKDLTAAAVIPGCILPSAAHDRSRMTPKANGSHHLGGTQSSQIVVTAS
jgi:ribosomal protein S18 acetylase RimI-like enzyme